jgi:hypothetical protein
LAKRFCLQCMMPEKMNPFCNLWAFMSLLKKPLYQSTEWKKASPKTKRNYIFFFPQKSNKFSLTNHIFIASFMTKFHKTSDNEKSSS